MRMEREEMEDGVVLCLSALVCLVVLPRRRLFCIWLQWALVGLGFCRRDSC
jgi:hypothetical protein